MAFSMEDKVRIAQHLDALGIQYMTVKIALRQGVELPRGLRAGDDASRRPGRPSSTPSKLCLSHAVVMSDRCAFRYRVYESSYGLAQSIEILATSINQLLRSFDTDPLFREFARAHPERWSELRGYLEENKLTTYYWRWRHMYRRRLTRLQWVRAAFAFPYSWLYYRRVFSALLSAARYAVTGRARRLSPWKRRL